jgi:acyl carrier protein
MLSGTVEAELRSFGLHSIPPARLTTDLAAMLGSADAQAAFVAADWGRFVPLYQSRCPTGLFDALVPGLPETEKSEPGNPEAGDPVANDTRPIVDSPATLRLWLMSQLGATLQLAPDRLDADAPLPRLGLDSLLAVELRNRMEQHLGRTVPLSDLLGDLSLNDLADRLAAALPTPAPGAPIEAARVMEDWIAGEI